MVLRTGMTMKKALFVIAAVVALIASPAMALDFVWDGGDGEWTDSNWNGGESLDILVGVIDGADGWNSPINQDELEDGMTENIIIGGGTVSYPADELQADFEMRQGSTLQILEGGRWLHETTEDFSENRWTQLDLTALIIDGGTFSRIGEGPGDGGGALIFGSWQGDDTFDSPVAPIDYLDTKIEIKNGGRFENTGELWFGSWEDLPPNGSRIIMEINDGTLDLTGGDIPADDSAPGSGDLVFSNKYGDDEFDKPTFAINFTGPGQIIVDEAGIINRYVDDIGVWQEIEPTSYQSLWDAGILQANGQSGIDGATFDDYFSVTGQPEQNDYTLTSKISVGPVGDYNGSGDLDAGDLDVLAGWINDGDLSGDANGDSVVDADDRTYWVHELQGSYIGDSDFNGEFNSGDLVTVFAAGLYETGNAATYGTGDWDGSGQFDSGDLVVAFADGGFEQGPRAATAAVPEPASFGMLALAGLLLSAVRRRR